MRVLHWKTFVGAALRPLCIAACATVHALAQGACGPYQVALYEHGILYSRGADGVYVGIDKDVIDTLAQRTGCTLQTALDSRVRIWAALEEGRLDMSVSGIATPQREAFAQFVPYFRTRNNVILRHDIAQRAQTPEAFIAQPDLRVAVVKSFKHGAQYDAWVDTLRSLGRVEEVADNTATFRLLKIGRVHATLGLPTTWMPLFESEHLADQVQVLDWYPQAEPILAGLILSKARVRADDAQRMAKALRAMRKDGTLETIYRRYVGTDLARQMVRY
jgi:polar amino acid transport system substrate-binding protein